MPAELRREGTGPCIGAGMERAWHALSDKQCTCYRTITPPLQKRHGQRMQLAALTNHTYKQEQH